ncbi:ERAD-associated protein [Malassezia vespertilionis]|uniref:Hrd3p n=1 Tax=Malassezia vespertilionis TaxID=2020962 RepID=A0A2N1JF96_9BASI|nr:ERAD-associated protein [Malassezia vespertilionis]PKI85222.1 Hrd3p [Malassezia vespertilionis]WFD06113.1 ERAD-associated protein [Malassezia vespertilionis]
MRLLHAVVLGSAALAYAAQPDADTLYQEGLAELRTLLLDTEYHPVQKSGWVAYTSQYIHNWVAAHDGVYAPHGDRRVYTGPVRWAVARILDVLWKEHEPQRRAARTVYDAPATVLWPEWEWNAAMAAHANAARPSTAVHNGWEQVVWGPFCMPIDPPDAPHAALYDIQAAYPRKDALWHLVARYAPTAASFFQHHDAQHEAARARRADAIHKIALAALEHAHPDALWVLAEHSLWGTHGAQPAIPRAIDAYTKLAEMGNASAHARLGFLYNSAYMHAVYNTPVSPSATLLHLHAAASQGNRHAQLALGYKYAHGLGTPKNCTTALHWYHTQARHVFTLSKATIGGRRLPYSKNRLADMHRLMTWDLHWDEEFGATAHLSPGASHCLSDTALLDNFLSQYPRACQSPAASLSALDRLEYIAMQGNHQMQLFLAYTLYQGSLVAESESYGAVPRDLQGALRWALLAARRVWKTPVAKVGLPDTFGAPLVEEMQPHSETEAGCAVQAARLLGYMYLRGEGTKPDMRAAYIWFSRAFHRDASHRSGQHGLGLLARLGVPGLAANETFATHLFEKGQEVESVLEHIKGLGHARQEVSESWLMVLEHRLFGKTDSDSPMATSYLEPLYLYATVMVYKNNFAPCYTKARAMFQLVAEMGDWEDPVFHRADAAYERGDLYRASLGWALAADAGIEEAQHNLAYLLDPFIHAQAPQSDAALQYWAQSSLRYRWYSEKDWYAQLRVCQHLALRSNWSASACYKELAGYGITEAYWHLGRMYEQGLRTKRNFALALFSFRQAAVTLVNTNAAYLGNTVSMIWLHFHALYAWLWQRDVSARAMLATYFGEKPMAWHSAPASSFVAPWWLDYFLDAIFFSAAVVALFILYLRRDQVQQRIHRGVRPMRARL